LGAAVPCAADEVAPHLPSKAASGGGAGAQAAPTARDVQDARIEAARLLGRGTRNAALEAYERAMSLASKVHGAHSAPVAELARERATVYLTTGDHVAASAAYARALEIAEKAFGSAHPSLVAFLDMAATSRRIVGDNSGAARLYARAFRIIEASTGEQHPQYTQVLVGLAMQTALLGDHDRADVLFKRYSEHAEKRWGPTSSMFFHALDLYGSVLQMRQHHAAAEQVFRRSLALREKHFGRNSVDVVTSLTYLAWIHFMRGDHTRSHETFRRILRIYQGAGPMYREACAAFLEQLGHVYSTQGNKDASRKAYDEALSIRRAVLAEKEKDPSTHAATLTSQYRVLATHYRQRGDFAKAEALWLRVLERDRKEHGDESLSTMSNHLLLGALAQEQDRLDDAEKHLRRSLVIHEKMLGDRLPGALHYLVELEERRQRFAEAEKLQRRVHAGFESSYSARHPSVAHALHRLALHRWAQDDVPGALALFARAEEAFEANIQLVLPSGAEKDKRAFLDQLGGGSHVDHAVSLHLTHTSSAMAASHAATLILRRKGRLLDALSDALGAARRRAGPETVARLDTLRRKRAELARLIVRGRTPTEEMDRYLARVASLEDAVRALEQGLMEVSPQLRAAAAPITASAVSARIPKDARLIELIAFRPLEPKKGHHLPRARVPPARYAAYVLAKTGLVAVVDLGAAAAIDERVKRLRAALSSPTAADALARAKALAKKILAPLEPHIGDASHLFLSPDGALNLVPFAALPMRDGRALIEKYRLSYLSSGRDLLRARSAAAPRSGAVVVAAPSFGSPQLADEGLAREGGAVEPKPTGGEAKAASETDATSAPAWAAWLGKSRGTRSYALGAMSWSELPGTAQEAIALRALLPNPIVLTGDAATEAAVKALKAPSILHIATHGFFLPREESKGVPGVLPENPLLRSGLVLSGANRRESGEEDGILTALEAASLDLAGTELVVLSACETGLGDIEAGDGVYGLRRALVLAGAESQVMTLWRVDDASSRELMEGFYQRLRAGEGRAEALRQAQLAMLRDTRRAHPFFWAAFIQSGAPGPLRNAEVGRVDGARAGP
jgi:CHAT domain-containing protein/Tfp pilus assembly protein PilF